MKIKALFMTWVITMCFLFVYSDIMAENNSVKYNTAENNISYEGKSERISDIDNILSIDKPIIDNGVLKYSMTANEDISEFNIIATLYNKGILFGVSTNKLNGEFELNSDGIYMMKVFVWKRNTLEPITKCYTFDNIKSDKKELRVELNNILPGADGNIHYTYYLPQNYDEKKSYPMLVTLPGWSSRFNTIETTPLTENDYALKNAEAWTSIVGDMIVVSPSLTDWGNKSARQTIELIEYFIDNFSVDTKHIYAAGYSAGGETMSRVVDMRPELFAAYLHSASQWDVGYTSAAQYRIPIYIWMGERDEYYGAQTAERAYNNLKTAYRNAGISDSDIDKLLVLDLKNDTYFNDKHIGSHHGGGYFFASDTDIIQWMTANK